MASETFAGTRVPYCGIVRHIVLDSERTDPTTESLVAADGGQHDAEMAGRTLYTCQTIVGMEQ